MLVDPSNQTAGATVTGAIRQAAQATGTSFQYLLATAQVESGSQSAGRRLDLVGARAVPVHRPDLACHHEAIRSGAWLRPIRRRHHQDRVRPLRGGRSGRCAAKFSSCATIRPRMRPWRAPSLKPMPRCCRQQLGRSPSEGELYIAHFLGAGGAARLISSAAANPNASAASYFPIAAHANTSIFYDRSTGAPRTPRRRAQRSHRALRRGGAVAAEYAGQCSRPSRYSTSRYSASRTRRRICQFGSI